MTPLHIKTIAALALLVALFGLCGMAIKCGQANDELKAKLLLGGISANAIQCAYDHTTVNCVAAALEKVPVPVTPE